MNLKRKYFNLRLGFTNSSPFIQSVNFVLISYNTILLMAFDVPFWIYAPLFVLLMFSILVLIGHVFRKYQHDTDLNMVFERQTNQAKIFYLMMEAIKTGKTNKDFDQYMDYLKRIYEKRI